MKFFLALALIVGVSLKMAESKPDKVVCYFASWARYRQGDGSFTVDNIDANLCTHLIYTFVGIKPDGTVQILDSWNDIDLRGFEKFNELKKLNNNLKTLIAVGGWNEGSAKYSAVAADATMRRRMITSALDIITKHGFDGFDLDWEYPGQRGGSPADKVNFITLIKEFREEFDRHGLLLTAAVGASQSAIEQSYDVPQMAKYLSWINVMTYDMHGPWQPYTGINAPLYASSKDTTAESKQLNVDACIQAWLAAGAPPQKLALGTGFYGKSFALSNPSNTDLYAPTQGAGPQGPYTGEGGMYGYHEICEYIKNDGWTEKWEDEQLVPYAFKGNVWVGYDNVRSIQLKVEYAQKMDLGGIMVWAIDTDDFRGKCGKPYPLLTAINEALGNEVHPQPPPTPPATTTSAPGSDFQCPGSGYYRDPINCAVFYLCVGANAEPVRFDCPAGTYFDPAISGCDLEENVQC